MKDGVDEDYQRMACISCGKIYRKFSLCRIDQLSDDAVSSLLKDGDAAGDVFLFTCRSKASIRSWTLTENGFEFHERQDLCECGGKLG